MLAVVNFADSKFKRNQRWSSFSAKVFGKADKVFEFSSKDIEMPSLNKNKENSKFYSKGFGNYFWKPFVVKKALENLEYGDYLMYADSGSFFIKSILPLIKHMEKAKKNILCFRLPLIEKQWTKRDAFILMDCDSKKYINTPQILATFFILRKSDEAIEFINSWQDNVNDNRILSDDCNVLGKPNYKEFIEHRHDQSVLSLLCKKHNNILIERDLSDYGSFPYRYTLDSKHIFDKRLLDNTKKNTFRSTVLCNRSGHPLLYYIRFIIRSIIYKFGFKV